MAEQRCAHGFLRSVVPCPKCDAGAQRGPRAWSPERRKAYKAATHARRNAAVPHGLVGKYRCAGCGREKDLSEFYISRTHPSGHQSKCKVCDNNKRVERLRRAS